MNPMPIPASGGGSFAFILLALFGILTLASFVFWIWMLVDCIKHETDEGEARLWWAVGIGIFHFMGAAVYFFLRKIPRKRLTT